LALEVREVSLSVSKLAAIAIKAVAVVDEVLAQGLLVLRSNMCLLSKLMLTMSESAIMSKLTLLATEPEFAKLSLLLLLIFRLIDHLLFRIHVLVVIAEI
jgi:hypothetical protein